MVKEEVGSNVVGGEDTFNLRIFRVFGFGDSAPRPEPTSTEQLSMERSYHTGLPVTIHYQAVAATVIASIIELSRTLALPETITKEQIL